MADEVESKMQQIRLKNEKIEKKHKEILQDELEAKKIGAVVETKQHSSSKKISHPLDKLELDYDVNEVMRENAKNPDYKPKIRRPILGKKQLDEIPSDPPNFLKEEDGSNNSDGASSNQKSKQRSHQKNRNRGQPKIVNYNEDQQIKYDSIESSKNQPRNQNLRSKQQQNNLNSNNSDETTSPGVGEIATKLSIRKPPQQLRNEKRSAPTIFEHNQGHSNNSGELMQSNSNKIQSNRQRRSNNSTNKTQNQNLQQHLRPNRESNNHEINNITVQVNDDVRSVKIKLNEKKIGTGRVVRPQHQANIIDENAEGNPSNVGNKYLNKNHGSKQRKPKQKVESEILQHPILEKIVITKTSVQERLLRSKTLGDKDFEEKSKTEIGNEHSTLIEN